MNAANFVNSRDVAEHLNKVHYTFSPIEAAWLVLKSKNHTLKEKHAALREIIDTLPDASIESLSEIPYTDGLHRYLQDYVKMETALLEDFIKPDGDCVYTYKILFEDDNTWHEEYDVYACFEDAFSAFTEDLDPLPRFAEFTKSKIGKNGYKIYCRMTVEGDAVSLSRSEFPMDSKDGEIFYHVLDWDVKLPHPFVAGDILAPAKGKYTRLPPIGGTFVLAQNDKGAFDGLFASEDGTLSRESVDDGAIPLSDCEYVRTELENEDRLLASVGDYLKGKTDLVGLLTAHKAFLRQK